MKCPHCNTGIAEGFGTAQFAQFPQGKSPEGFVIPKITWTARFQRCSECYQSIIHLDAREEPGRSFSFLAYPKSKSARPIPADVTDPYRQDFIEACIVLEDSAKASAALSRRCLQAILRDKAGTKAKDLYDQIEEIIQSAKLPSHISEDLHAVRIIGNFAAHPLKSTVSGLVLDVEPGEAEWNLDVLELLFNYYFVQPAISARRKSALNKKLKEAGKPELL